MFRTEYPRPQLVRKEWLNLNGQWDFEFNDKNVELKEKWFNDQATTITMVKKTKQKSMLIISLQLKQKKSVKRRSLYKLENLYKRISA